MKSADTHCPVLIQSLLDPTSYRTKVTRCELVETHISWVILTDSFVYKIKKPVNLGFLDFSSLEKRHYYCDEELRLNRRLAPEIYLSVIPITGTENKPTMEGTGEPIEYAVKMTPFPQECQLDRLLASGQLFLEHMDAFGKVIAEFHQHTARASKDSNFGDPLQVVLPVEENFKQIQQFIYDKQTTQLLEKLKNWSNDQAVKLRSLFSLRKEQGYIRECHGDMHLRNLAWFNNKPLVFDCIEFNPELRWIDVISDIAFLVMDLQDRGQEKLAQRFLNRYLEHSGDYAGMRILPFYLVYRSMVRAKVASIRLGQEGLDDNEQSNIRQELHTYLQLANSYTLPSSPKLIITYGLSASGKSTVSQALLENMKVIRIRSDLERKRIYGVLDNLAGTQSPTLLKSDLYSRNSSDTTYARLLDLAGLILDSGYSVVVDATFLVKQYRDNFRQLAFDRHVPFVILEFVAAADTLRARIKSRKQDISDADLEVLERQLRNIKTIRNEEKQYIITVDTEKKVDIDLIVNKINRQTDYALI